VNGVPGTPVAYTPSVASTGAVQIGRGLTNSVYAGYCGCWIDQTQVWDRTLMSWEISDATQVMDPGSGLAQPDVMRDWRGDDSDGVGQLADNSGYNFDLYLDGATIKADDADMRGNVIGLDGVSNYGQSGYGGLGSTGYDGIDCQGSFTANAWVNLSSGTLGTGARTAYVLGKAGGTQATWALWYAQTAGPDTGYWYFGRTSADTSAATTTTIKSETPAQTDGWVMLSVVYDSFNHLMRLYINGFEQNAGGTPFATPWQTSGLFSVGVAIKNGTWGGYFPGEIDDIKLSVGVTDQVTLFNEWWAESES